MKSPITEKLSFLRENAFIFSAFPIIVCSIAYFQQILELQLKWDVSAGIIDGMKMQYLFLIAISLAYCISMAFIQEYINKLFIKNTPSLIRYKYVQKLLKTITKLNAKHYSKKTTLMNVKKSLHSYRLFLLKSIIISALIGSLIYLPFFLLFYILVLNVNFQAALVYFLISMASLLATQYILISKKTKDEIRTYKVQNKKLDYKTCISICEKLMEHDKPQEEKTNFIISAIITIFMLIICIILRIAYIQKDFWIYTDDSNNSYAVVFETSNNIITKKADIDGDKITIHLNDQLYISPSGLQTKHIKFNTTIIER